MKYKDKLQSGLVARALKVVPHNPDHEVVVGLLMLEFNLFYEEAKQRWEQAVASIKHC